MNEKCYAIVKHVRQDFNGETYVLAVTGSEELAKKRFNEAVAAEKSQQNKFGYSYDTVDESDTTYMAYDEGYEATDSISIFITEAPFIG